jgi:hypothetical protein
MTQGECTRSLIGAFDSVGAAMLGRAQAPRASGLVAFVVLALALVGGRVAVPVASVQRSSIGQASALVSAATGDAVMDHLIRPPLTFAENAGQANRSVRYEARGPQYSFAFTRERVLMSFVGQDSVQGNERRATGVTLALEFEGANPDVSLKARKRAPGRVNYLIGADPKDWHTNLTTYKEVVYRDLWPGIDMIFSGTRGRLKYDLVADPGAPMEEASLAYKGAEAVSVGHEGALMLETAVGTLEDSAPTSYQPIAGKRVSVDSRFAMQPDEGSGSHFGFVLGDYDARRRVVVDPGVAYSTFLGGGNSESGDSIAVDETGSAYVTGLTLSEDFPTTPGAFDTTGRFDAFVTKLDPAGDALAYSTFLGGSSQQSGTGIAVDDTGSAYITGSTNSDDFPTTPGAFDDILGGDGDAFVTKLAPSGAALVYSTLLGGTDGDDFPRGVDFGNDIAVDRAGRAHVTGVTESHDFPTTPRAFDDTLDGFNDAFVTKLNRGGTKLVYSTLLGGDDFDFGSGIAVDNAGSAHVTGGTSSPDFPTTRSAFDRTFGNRDAFVTKLRPRGAALAYSTFLGGDDFDSGNGIAVDKARRAYVTGETRSENFPTTSSAFDDTLGGVTDAFVTRLERAGAQVAYSTFLGGDESIETGNGIAVDKALTAYVTGETRSADFPTTPEAFDQTLGFFDAFVTKFDIGIQRQ